MVEYEKEDKFMKVIKTGLSYISQIVSSNIFSPIADSAETIIRNVEERIMQFEKRVIRKMYSISIIVFGCTFLVFSLFFFLIENLNWTKTVSFFFIGIIIFVTGLLLRLLE